MLSKETIERVCAAINRDRLVETAVALVGVPSPTCDAGLAADRMADLLRADGFAVERPEANWPKAPAVVTQLDSGRSGRRLQFDGHLDTVHLPFVPPSVREGILRGSGASDMKGGVAACIEALRVLREVNALEGGRVLLTAHDHHEGPWGDKRQVTGLIDAGYVGDAVLLPEYLSDRLPLAGRGMAIFEVKISRSGTPIHEVLRPSALPDVLGTGAEIVSRLKALGKRLSELSEPYAGSDSVFVGQIHAGEIYNQAPTECRLHGTRRWVKPDYAETAQAEFVAMMAAIGAESGTQIETAFSVQAEAFRVSERDPVVTSFQAAHQAVTGASLPFGDKPFVDDGNRYASLAQVPVLTHGPNARGAHTTDEWVPIDELVRVAQVYALTAVGYCGERT